SVVLIEQFENNFSEVKGKTNFDYLQGLFFDNNENKNSSPGDFSGYAVPVMDGAKVVGRYIWTEDQEKGVYIDYTSYEDYVTIYSLTDHNDIQKIATTLNPETDIYEPVYENKGFWCGAACAVGTIAIAASDGPVPVMDVLAAAYAVTCLASCNE